MDKRRLAQVLFFFIFFVRPPVLDMHSPAKCSVAHWHKQPISQSRGSRCRSILGHSNPAGATPSFKIPLTVMHTGRRRKITDLKWVHVSLLAQRIPALSVWMMNFMTKLYLQWPRRVQCGKSNRWITFQKSRMARQVCLIHLVKWVRI